MHCSPFGLQHKFMNYISILSCRLEMDKCGGPSHWQLVEKCEAFDCMAFVGSGQTWWSSRTYQNGSSFGANRPFER